MTWHVPGVPCSGDTEERIKKQMDQDTVAALRHQQIRQVIAVFAAWTDTDSLDGFTDDDLAALRKELRALDKHIGKRLNSKGGRSVTVKNEVIDHARRLLALEAPGSKHRQGFRYTLTEVAKIVGMSASALSERLQQDGNGTIAEQRRRIARERKQQEKR